MFLGFPKTTFTILISGKNRDDEFRDFVLTHNFIISAFDQDSNMPFLRNEFSEILKSVKVKDMRLTLVTLKLN